MAVIGGGRCRVCGLDTSRGGRAERGRRVCWVAVMDRWDGARRVWRGTGGMSGGSYSEMVLYTAKVQLMTDFEPTSEGLGLSFLGVRPSLARQIALTSSSLHRHLLSEDRVPASERPLPHIADELKVQHELMLRRSGVEVAVSVWLPKVRRRRGGA